MATNAILVETHLEMVPREILEKYPKIFLKFVRNVEGIYALYNGNKLYYVGKTKDFYARPKVHLKNYHKDKWDKFSIYVIKGNLNKELESCLLRIIRPPGNDKSGRFSLSNDLTNEIINFLLEEEYNKTHRSIFDIQPELIRPKAGVVSAYGKKPPVLSNYKKIPKYLYCNYKGRTIIDEVDDYGYILHEGHKYKSPSAAAWAITGSYCTNGWLLFEYQSSSGHWIKLDELRQK